jgi:hypothetical protein
MYDGTERLHASSHRRRYHVATLIVLLAVNALATILRFVTFRSWIFRPRRPGAPDAQEINL